MRRTADIWILNPNVCTAKSYEQITFRFHTLNQQRHNTNSQKYLELIAHQRP